MHSGVAILLWMVVCFSLSCNSDEDPLQPSDYIVIGNYQGMTVDSTGKEIEASYNSGKTITLDFNSDDTADFRLVVAMPGSPGMGIHYISQAESLTPACGLSGTFSTDTVFLRQFHSVFSDDYNNHYHTVASYYNCARTSPADRIFSVGTRFHARNLKKGETLSNSGIFIADTVSFIYTWNSPQTFNVANDTVYITNEYFSFLCNTIPYGQDIYLGLLFGSKNPLLGWVKLRLQSENKIVLKEFAIQRNPVR